MNKILISSALFFIIVGVGFVINGINVLNLVEIESHKNEWYGLGYRYASYRLESLESFGIGLFFIGFSIALVGFSTESRTKRINQNGEINE